MFSLGRQPVPGLHSTAFDRRADVGGDLREFERDIGIGAEIQVHAGISDLRGNRFTNVATCRADALRGELPVRIRPKNRREFGPRRGSGRFEQQILDELLIASADP